MKAVVGFITVLFLLFYSPFVKPVFAVTVTISDYPSTITQDSFTITASISGATTNTNYLRIDIFKDGAQNYFGETFNGSDWYGGSTYSQYLPVSIVSGITWSGSMQGRIGSPTSSEYDGSGVYKIRLRRYTSTGGNTATEADNSAMTISISLPTPTPTPAPTPTPTPTATPTPSPTSTPIPTPTSTSVPTLIPTVNTPASQSNELPVQENTTQPSVLGESAGNGLDIAPPSNLVSDQAKKPDTLFHTILILLGIALIATCAILTFRIIKKGELTQDEEQ